MLNLCLRSRKEAFLTLGIMGKKVKYRIAETFQEDGGPVKVSLRIAFLFSWDLRNVKL